MKNPNPLIEQGDIKSLEVETEVLVSKTVFASKPGDKRELRRLFRKESATEAITGFRRGHSVFGFTKGQFSLVELIEAVLEKTGPAEVTISTWTAANADLNNLLGLIKSKSILSARFLLDFTFQRRQPAMAKNIRDKFGSQALRITRNHAKFFLISTEGEEPWRISCKTSMNLNHNPRFEDFDLADDQKLFDFLKAIVDELFSQTRRNPEKQFQLSTTELHQQFLGHN